MLGPRAAVVSSSERNGAAASDTSGDDRDASHINRSRQRDAQREYTERIDDCVCFCSPSVVLGAHFGLANMANWGGDVWYSDPSYDSLRDAVLGGTVTCPISSEGWKVWMPGRGRIAGRLDRNGRRRQPMARQNARHR
jgi:hypothetical protein